MEEEKQTKHKYSISEHENTLPVRPNIKASTESAVNEVYTGSGVSLNDILNKKKRSGNQDAEDFGYAASMLNEIREKNLAKAKRAKVAFLSFVGGIILLLIILMIVFSDLAQILIID